MFRKFLIFIHWMEPSAAELEAKLLTESYRQLVDAEQLAEHYKSRVAMLKTRIARLENSNLKKAH